MFGLALGLPFILVRGSEEAAPFDPMSLDPVQWLHGIDGTTEVKDIAEGA